MLRNYFLLTWRFFKRHRGYVFLNLLGLCLGFSSSIVAFLVWQYNYGFDHFHEKHNEVYRITSRVNNQGDQYTLESSPQALAQYIRDSVPEAGPAVRYQEWKGAHVQAGEQLVPVQSGFADSPAFFELFTFPLAAGSPGNFGQPQGIFITEPLAAELFGAEAGAAGAMSKPLRYQFSDGTSRDYTVIGVLAKYPYNSSLVFQVLLPYTEYLAFNNMDDGQWQQHVQATFVHLPQDQQLPLAIEAMQARVFRQQEAAAPTTQKVLAFWTHTVGNMAHQNLWQYQMQPPVPPQALWGSGGLSLLFLLIAIFNNINTGMVMTGRRLKEVAVRKTVGGTHRQIALQFLSESLAVVLLAMAVAIVLTELTMASYNTRWQFLTLEIDYGGNLGLWLFIFSLMAISLLLIASYPAFFIGRIMPANILRGKARLGGNNRLARILITCQFAVAVISLSGTLTFIQNANYLKHFNTGYAHDELLVLKMRNAKEYQTAAPALRTLSQIENVAGSQQYIGQGFFPTRVSTATGQSFMAAGYQVGPRYPATVALQFRQGGSFAPALPNSGMRQAIINQTMAERLGWPAAVDSVIYGADSLPYQICGVVEDFYLYGVWAPMLPTIITTVEPQAIEYLTLRLAPGSTLQEANQKAEALWKQQLPQVPFELVRHNRALQDAELINDNLAYSLLNMAVIILLLSSAGLYAMVGLNLLRRTKEIGIRKVMGGPIARIAWQVNRHFVVLMAAAAVLGIAAGWPLIKLYLDELFLLHAPLGPEPFIVALLLMGTTAGLAVFFLLRRAVRRNPVESLKDE